MRPKSRSMLAKPCLSRSKGAKYEPRRAGSVCSVRSVGLRSVFFLDGTASALSPTIQLHGPLYINDANRSAKLLRVAKNRVRRARCESRWRRILSIASRTAPVIQFLGCPRNQARDLRTLSPRPSFLSNTKVATMQFGLLPLTSVNFPTGARAVAVWGGNASGGGAQR